MEETPPPPGCSHSPGILVVEAQSDLVDTARVGHHQVEARLRGETELVTSSGQNETLQ